MARPAPRARRHRLALLVAAGVVGLGLAAGPASAASAATTTTSTAIPGANTKHLTIEQRWMDEVLMVLLIGAAVGLASWRPELPWRRRPQT